MPCDTRHTLSGVFVSDTLSQESSSLTHSLSTKHSPFTTGEINPERMFSLLVHTECVLVLISALTIPNFFILDGYAYRYNIYLVFGGMPGINDTRDCDGFFDCFYMECVSNISHFGFNSHDCGLSVSDFSRRFSPHADIHELIYMANMACITYSCLASLVTVGYMMIRRIEGVRGRVVIVFISTLIILCEILVRVTLISLVLYIEEIDVYLPNFLTDYNSVAAQKTMALGMTITALVTITSFLISLKSVDPGMSEFTPLAWETNRDERISSDEQSESS